MQQAVNVLIFSETPIESIILPAAWGLILLLAYCACRIPAGDVAFAARTLIAGLRRLVEPILPRAERKGFYEAFRPAPVPVRNARRPGVSPEIARYRRAR